jgi:hypothetical protein
LAICGESACTKRTQEQTKRNTGDVTKAVYKQFILNKVLPAIKEKWPQCHRNMAIKLQQDHEKSHRIHNDPEVLEKHTNMTVTVNLFDQPPNSLDLNVLDLGDTLLPSMLSSRNNSREQLMILLQQ